MNMLNGKRTYVMVAMAFVSALALYVNSVLANGFDFSEFIKFVNSETAVAALAFLRSAIGKK